MFFASRDLLGTPVGAFLGPLGVLFGHLLAVLGPSWASLGPSGPSWKALRGPLRPPGALWGRLGALWGRLGALWGRLGRSRGAPDPAVHESGRISFLCI